MTGRWIGIGLLLAGIILAVPQQANAESPSRDVDFIDTIEPLEDTALEADPDPGADITPKPDGTAGSDVSVADLKLATDVPTMADSASPPDLGSDASTPETLTGGSCSVSPTGPGGTPWLLFLALLLLIWRARRRVRPRCAADGVSRHKTCS